MPMQCRDAGWAGGGLYNRSSAEPGTLGVNGKVQGTAGEHLGEAEPDEAEEASGERAFR